MRKAGRRPAKTPQPVSPEARRRAALRWQDEWQEALEQRVGRGKPGF